MLKASYTSMERIGCQQIHFTNNIQSPHTFHKPASTDTLFKDTVEKVQHPSFTRDDHSYSGVGSEWSFGKTKGFEFRIPFQDVFGNETRWGGTSNIRPERTKQTHYNKTLPTGVTSRCSEIFTEVRLDGENRPNASLLSRADCRVTPALSKSLLQPSSSATVSSTLRSFDGASNVCYTNKLDRGDLTRQGYTTSSLFRRLPSGKSEQNPTSGSGLGDLEYPRKFGLAYQLPKVSTGTISGTGVLRNFMEYQELYHGLTSIKKDKNKKNNCKSSRKRLLQPKRDSNLIRATKFRKSNHSKRALTLSPNSKIHKSLSSEQKMVQKSYTSHSKKGTCLVAKCHRSQHNSSTEQRSNSLLDHRRIGCGLGCSPQREASVGQVESTTKILAFKHKRTVCSIQCNKTKPELPTQCSCPHTVGQQVTGSIHQERRGNTVPCTTRADNEAPRAVGTLEHDTLGGVPPGEIQRHSRPPVKKSTSAGMALTAPGLGGRIQNLGHTRHRSVCNKRIYRSRALRNLGLQRWIRRLLRRLQSPLEFQSCLGVSTTQSDSTRATSPQYCDRHLHNNSTSMDTLLLANRSEGTSSGRTSPNKEPTQESDRSHNWQETSNGGEAGTPSLESWGWDSKVAHWSAKERDLLKQSWRESTLTTYKAPIKRWIAWCQVNNIDSRTPQGNDVARFLAKLYLEDHLAYRTILLHKSAVSTYSATSSDNIAKNFFVHRVLKAISLVKPPEKKTVIWDTQLLFNWLKNNPSTESLFDTARRTAIILLLASGRRIHDLTLLDLSKDNLLTDDEKHEILLWPRFGSKTDSADNRQSGWLLKAHPEEYLCPVKHIKKLIEATENRRTKVTGLTSLFISITGVIKPATQTIIGSWIKSILKDAGVDASPGSVRSAVASRSFLENRPIEEILRRGNWRSSQTFKKFYCRAVIRSTTQIQNHNTGPDQLLNNFLIP